MRLDFKNLIRVFDSFITPQPNTGKIDLKNYTYIEPVGLAALKSIALEQNGLTLILPDDPDARQYVKTVLSSSYDPDKTYIPIAVVKSYNSEENKKRLVNKILEVDDFRKLNYEDKRDLRNYLDYMIGELLNNAIYHANSPVGAVICGQYFRQLKKLQIAVVDRGVGFLHNIRRICSVEKEFEAIEMALKPGITSRPIGTYQSTIDSAGYGLYVLHAILQHTKGRLIIISNDGAIYFDGNTGGFYTYDRVSSVWKGSIVAFEFQEGNINESLDTFFRIYINEPEEDEEIDDYLDFQEKKYSSCCKI